LVADVPNTYELSDSTAVVTGGSRGIGLAIVRRLAASGSRVWVWDAHPIALDGVTSMAVDVTSPEQVDRALAVVIERDSRVDILVNNAGYLGTLHAFEEHPPEDWRKIVEVNLIGMLTVTQKVLPLMRRAFGGRIVNLGSLAGQEGHSHLAAYSAASAGVIAFTKALGREVAGSNVFVNCVAPGPIDTDMIRALGEDAVHAMIDESPLKRLGMVEEVAQLVAWLCSDASRFNTGAVFDMSGGRARY
jgi:3-oxoacyl-[acyl-carrier protein] reductase